MTAGTNRKRVAEVEGAELADEQAVTLTATTPKTKPAGKAKKGEKAGADKGKHRAGGGSDPEGGPYTSYSQPVDAPAEDPAEPEPQPEPQPQPVGPEGGPYTSYAVPTTTK
ncbi:hypothetical protein [Saccharothrix variisporea]|uniref:Uncharacterized protein n=1 Tax=Saccharothrix variisporea TaxID=543527 RepID=A0A495XKD0_9PSEU|nr:hypothetical protein [Saccharothrix variisporea]RKT72873.1 hypothetical protein DFJ66_6197 [Saccharothrix variisporea]